MCDSMTAITNTRPAGKHQMGVMAVNGDKGLSALTVIWTEKVS
jgi:hypothetical protein